MASGLLEKRGRGHLAELLLSHKFKRLQSEANVYVNLALGLVALVYVDGLMTVGNRANVTTLMTTLSSHLLLNPTGDLSTESVDVSFSGRVLTKTGDTVRVRNSETHVSDMLALYE